MGSGADSPDESRNTEDFAANILLTVVVKCDDSDRGL